jgi:CRP-like cAMP-binding protein
MPSISRLEENKSGAARRSDLALRSLSRFGSLPSDAELHVEEALDHSQTAPLSTELISEGEALNVPRILTSGWAARIRVFGDGRRRIIGFFLPGDIFGLSNWPGSRAIYPIVSLTPASYAAIPLLANRCCCQAQANDRLMFAIGQMLRVDELRQFDQVIRMGLTAYERVAHLLLEFYCRLKVIGFVHSNSYVLPVSQGTLGDALALCAVHTNRVLQQLRRDRLIQMHGSIITIPEVERLMEIADFQLPML